MKRSECKYGILRQMGKCVRCKNDNPTPEKPHCPKCDEYLRLFRKESRIWYKEHGICTKCQKTRAISGETLCPDCKDKQHIANKRRMLIWTEEEIQRNKDLSARATEKRTKERLAQGLCAKCGRHKLADTSKRLCSICLMKNRERSRKYRAKQLEEQGLIPQAERAKRGLCRACSKPYEPNGTQFCDECREKCRQRALKQDKTNWLKWNQRQNDLIFKRG